MLFLHQGTIHSKNLLSLSTSSGALEGNPGSHLSSATYKRDKPWAGSTLPEPQVTHPQRRVRTSLMRQSCQGFKVIAHVGPRVQDPEWIILGNAMSGRSAESLG